MPRKFRQLIPPGEIEAIQLLPQSSKSAAEWCGGIEVVEIDPLDSKLRFVAMNIPTEREVLRAEEGWWIVKDSDGLFHVMGPQEFTVKYTELLDNGGT